MLKLGILGHPIGHSLSPVLHSALMDRLGIHGEYRAYDVPPEELGATLARLRAEGFGGVNVTIPHKVEALTHLDGLSSEALLMGAANTVVFTESEAIGYNTDVEGFLAGLPEPVTNKAALILGGGGAARAVLAGLIQQKVGSVTVAVRNPAKTPAFLELGETCRRRYKTQTPIFVTSMERLGNLEPCEIVVNTTPVGMNPEPNACPLSETLIATLPENALVYDLIYRPRRTRLLTLAEHYGLRTQDGLTMLAHQGMAAFGLWTGETDALKSPELITWLYDQLQQAEAHV